MRYRRWTPAVLAIPALLLAACGSSTSPSSASGSNMGSSMATKSSTSSGMTGKSKSGSSGMSATADLIKVKTMAGPVLANSKGFTLYWYAKDTRMTSACTGSCATAWPPLTGTAMPTMGCG